MQAPEWTDEQRTWLRARQQEHQAALLSQTERAEDAEDELAALRRALTPGTSEHEAMVERIYERTETLWETDGFGPDQMVSAVLFALREAL
jgi:hypothetical protein